MKILVGKVKDNCSEDCKGIEGIELICFQVSSQDQELCVAGVLKFQDMEKFYTMSYEKSLRELISNDYEYCLWYVLNEDCELSCSIKLYDIEVIREVNYDDKMAYEKNLEKFKEIHHFYDIEKRIKDNEKNQKRSNEEFNNKEKMKISVRTEYGETTVDALIYKEFAIHNPIGVEDCPFKTITINKGPNKGKALVQACDIRNCKKLIDEVIETIGDIPIGDKDSSKLAELIKKY